MFMKRYMTEEEQRRLLKAARSHSDVLSQRDYHWMAALLMTGMRIAEFSRLTTPQVKLALKSGWLFSLKEHCKGKRRGNEYAVTLPLREHLTALVALSDAEAPDFDIPPTGQPLVWGRTGGHLSVRTYQSRFKHWVVEAGIDPRTSCHWMRHSRGMNIMRRSRGANAVKVAQLALNHASLKSTGVYLQMSREELAAELQAVDGRKLSKRAARALAMEGGV